MPPRLQFLYLLVDKLLIGLVIAGVVYFAQRRLERYKGLQSFQMEIDKERVKRIASHWEIMNNWDTTVGDLITAFTELVLTHYSSPQDGLRLESFVNPGLSKTIELLRKLNGEPVDSGALKDLCQTNLVSLMKESRDRALKVSESIQLNRFWLGEAMYKHCRHFQETLGNICLSFDRFDLDALQREIIELDQLRLDVLQAIDILHDKGAKAPIGHI